MSEEKNVFLGPSSQVLNFGAFALAAVVTGIALFFAVSFHPALAIILVVPAAYAIWKYLVLRFRIYEITTERIKITTGILTRKTDELELYRVKDLTLVEPLHLRLFKLGNIVLTTNDATTPSIEIVAIPGAKEIREELRRHVEACRQRKGVRLTEFE